MNNINIKVGGKNILMSCKDSENIGQFTHAIIDNAPSFKGKTVLDMGCGRGFIGLYAMLDGAKKVFFNDIEEEHVKASKLHYDLNGSLCDAEFIDEGCENISPTIIKNVDYFLINPPQLPLFMLPEVHKSKISETFRCGGYDGFSVIRTMLSSLYQYIIKPEQSIFITIGTMVNVDLFRTLALSYGFNAEVVGRSKISLNKEELGRAHPKIIEKYDEGSLYIKVFELKKNIPQLN